MILSTHVTKSTACKRFVLPAPGAVCVCERQRWLVREALRGTTCQVRQSLESLGAGVLCARVDHRPPEQQHLGQDWHATWFGVIHQLGAIHHQSGVIYQDLVHHHPQAISPRDRLHRSLYRDNTCERLC